MEDSRILELYWERSEEAITETQTKYGRYCHRIAKNILNSDEDAEECVNDSYLGVWNAIPPTRPNPLLTYVLKIVRNMSLNRYHKNHAQKRDSSYDLAVEELENVLAASESVEANLETAEITAAIESFLEEQKPLNRVIFVRRYWFYDSYMQIAKRTGLSEKNVSVKLTRMREKLKDYLEERGIFL